MREEYRSRGLNPGRFGLNEAHPGEVLNVVSAEPRALACDGQRKNSAELIGDHCERIAAT